MWLFHLLLSKIISEIAYINSINKVLQFKSLCQMILKVNKQSSAIQYQVLFSNQLIYSDQDIGTLGG